MPGTGSPRLPSLLDAWCWRRAAAYAGFRQRGWSYQPKVAARSSALAMASAQPRDHADVDRVRLGDLAQGFAGGTALERLLALIVRQLALAPELDACSLGALAALAGTLLDQIALKLGNCRKQRRKQPALRGGCIPQGIAERSKCRTGLADTFDQVKQLPDRRRPPSAPRAGPKGFDPGC